MAGRSRRDLVVMAKRRHNRGLPDRPLCVVRGGGDLATGVVWRLTRAGWPVVVTELRNPLTVRRTVSLSSAVTEGRVNVEGMTGVLVGDPPAALSLSRAAGNGAGGDHAPGVLRGAVAVLVAPGKEELAQLEPDVVVDARMAKRNLDTTIDDAPLVVALGPGFVAGVDCHGVVETNRGHRLGRVIWDGAAEADTGVAATVGGKGHERVLRAPADGVVAWDTHIGETVTEGERLGVVHPTAPGNPAQSSHDDPAATHTPTHPVTAPFGGVVRGLIGEGTTVQAGLKIGDLDPRCDPGACHEISDKSLAVGGGVLEAVLAWRNNLVWAQ